MPSICARVGGGPRFSMSAVALSRRRKATATASFAASMSCAAALSFLQPQRKSGYAAFWLPVWSSPCALRRASIHRSGSGASRAPARTRGFESSFARAACKVCSAAAAFSAHPLAFPTAASRVLSACLRSAFARPLAPACVYRRCLRPRDAAARPARTCRPPGSPACPSGR